VLAGLAGLAGLEPGFGVALVKVGFDEQTGPKELWVLVLSGVLAFVLGLRS